MQRYNCTRYLDKSFPIIMLSKIIMFTGAPEAGSLQWRTEDLTTPLLPCFTNNRSRAMKPSDPVTDTGPTWRSIPLALKRLRSGLTQQEEFEADVVGYDSSFGPDETSFLDTRNLSFESSAASQDTDVALAGAEEIATQFYEQSFMAHEDVQSSQIMGFESSNETSFMTATSDPSFCELESQVPQGSPFQSRPVVGHLCDLKNIPSAGYLRSINPQTMTVNLVVGIISMPQPRSIKTRRGGRMVELVEMTVGDETKAGFGINLWLQPTGLEGGSMKAVASRLRPQDVVLMRNVALSSFRSNVYGQSLRKDLTKIDLLYRNVLDRKDEAGVYRAHELDGDITTDPQTTKVKKVTEWVMRFVGAGNVDEYHSKGKDQKQKRHIDFMPPDTQ